MHAIQNMQERSATSVSSPDVELYLRTSLECLAGGIVDLHLELVQDRNVGRWLQATLKELGSCRIVLAPEGESDSRMILAYKGERN